MSFAEELEKRLTGGKFRLLNEKLYNEKSLTKKEALAYHKYYEEQTKKWPVDPRKMLADMIRAENPSAKIADVGCGSAFLSEMFPNVTSYDKYPTTPDIIKGDINSIPAPDNSFEVVVHCLSLMSSFIGRAVVETNRILEKDGMWYITEVRSRIINLKSFINNIEKLGFKLHKLETKNSYFVICVFKKIEGCTKEMKIPDVKLRPCLYKKR